MPSAMPWFHNLPSPTRHKFYSDLDQHTNEQSPILVGSKESYSVLYLMSQFHDMKHEVISMTLEHRGIAVPIMGNVQQDVQKIDDWLCATGDDTIVFVNRFTMLQLSSSDVAASEYGIDIRLLNTGTSSENSYTAKLCLKEFSADGSQSRLLYPGSGGYTHAVSLIHPRVTSTKENMSLGSQPHLHPLSEHLEHIESTLAQFSAEDRAQGSHSPHLSRTRIFRLLSALHTSSSDSKKRESQEQLVLAEHLRKHSEGEYDARVRQMGEGTAKPPAHMRKFDGEESPCLEMTYKRHPEWERDLWTRPSKSEDRMEKSKTPMDASRRKRYSEHRRLSVVETNSEHDISPRTTISTPAQKVLPHPRLSLEHPMWAEEGDISMTMTSLERNVSPKTNLSTRRKKSPEHERTEASLKIEVSPRHETLSKHKKNRSHSSTASDHKSNRSRSDGSTATKTPSDHKSTRTRTSSASTTRKTPSVYSWSTLTEEEVDAFYAQSPVPEVNKKESADKASTEKASDGKASGKGMRACLKSRCEKLLSRLGNKT